MYPLYEDIRKRLGPPLWIDQHGVPRYDDFRPEDQGIYDDWAALFLVECQSCGQLFHCGRGWTPLDDLADRLEQAIEDSKTPEGALEHLIFWGDAPWHTDEGHQDDFDGQCAGTTMTTSIVDILELWHRVRCEWEKVPVTKSMLEEYCDASDHGYEREVIPE